MNKKESLVVKASKGSSMTLLNIGSSRLLGALYGLVIARGLTAEDYGLLTFMVTSVALVWSIINLHVGRSAVRYIAAEGIGTRTSHRLASSCFWYYLIVGLTSGVLMASFGDWIAKHIFHITGSSLAFQVGGLLLFGISMYAVFSSLFTAHLRIDYDVLVRICKQTSLLIFAILFLQLGWSLTGVLSALAISEIIRLLSGWVMARRILPTTVLVKNFNVSSLSRLLTFGITLYLITFIEQIGESINVFSLATFTSQAGIAEYKVAVGLSSLLTIIAHSIAVPLMPIVAEKSGGSAHAKTSKDLEHAVNRLLKYAFCAVLPLTMLTYIFSDTLMTILFEERYPASIPILQIVIFADLLQSMVLLFNSILIGLGSTVACLKCALVTTLVGSASSLFLTRRLGTLGAAMAYLIAGISGLVVSILLYTMTTSNRIRKMPYVKIGAISTVSCLPVLMTKSLEPSIALLQFVSSLILYVLLLVVFRVLDEEDLSILSSVGFLRPMVSFARRLQNYVYSIG